MSKVFNVFKLPSVIQTVIQGVQGVLVQNIQIGLSVLSVQEQAECLRRLVFDVFEVLWLFKSLWVFKLF